jgi:hypothetical protein
MFFWGASPGSAGCFKKPTQIPNAGHPIYFLLITKNTFTGFSGFFRIFPEYLDFRINKGSKRMNVLKVLMM